jgi:hypothetical protein
MMASNNFSVLFFVSWSHRQSVEQQHNNNELCSQRAPPLSHSLSVSLSLSETRSVIRVLNNRIKFIWYHVSQPLHTNVNRHHIFWGKHNWLTLQSHPPILFSAHNKVEDLLLLGNLQIFSVRSNCSIC